MCIQRLISQVISYVRDDCLSCTSLSALGVTIATARFVDPLPTISKLRVSPRKLFTQQRMLHPNQRARGSVSHPCIAARHRASSCSGTIFPPNAWKRLLGPLGWKPKSGASTRSADFTQAAAMCTVHRGLCDVWVYTFTAPGCVRTSPCEVKYNETSLC